MFLLKFEKTATRVYTILKEVCRHGSLSHNEIFKWFKKFKDGQETTEDNVQHYIQHRT